LQSLFVLAALSVSLVLANLPAGKSQGVVTLNNSSFALPFANTFANPTVYANLGLTSSEKVTVVVTLTFDNITVSTQNWQLDTNLDNLYITIPPCSVYNNINVTDKVGTWQLVVDSTGSAANITGNAILGSQVGYLDNAGDLYAAVDFSPVAYFNIIVPVFENGTGYYPVTFTIAAPQSNPNQTLNNIQGVAWGTDCNLFKNDNTKPVNKGQFVKLDSDDAGSSYTFDLGMLPTGTVYLGVQSNPPSNAFFSFSYNVTGSGSSKKPSKWTTTDTVLVVLAGVAILVGVVVAVGLAFYYMKKRTTYEEL